MFTASLFSQYTTSATSKNLIAYDNTSYINNLTNTPLCPTIIDFFPKKIHSGNKEVLTIIGSGFGSMQGNVLFKNADDGGTNYLSGLDDVYIKPNGWTDTKIEVYVPSLVTEGGEAAGAGSGTFKVVTANGKEVSSTSINDSIDIEYAFMNVGDGSENLPFNISQLTKRNCLNGLLFTLHTSIRAYPDAVSSIQSAVNDWSNALGISVALEKNASNQLVYVSDTNAVNKNVIWFDANYTGLAVTKPGAVFDKSGGVTKYYLTNADIKLIHPSKINWEFSPTASLQSNKQDFYSTILHEMGHAIGLDHDMDPAHFKKELMYWAEGTYPDGLLANQRFNLTQYGSRSVAGAKAKIAIDKATTWVTAGVATLGTDNPTPPTIAAFGNTTICQGNSVILISNKKTGNTWSTGATTQNIQVTTSGNYSVSYNEGGCTVTSAVKNVTVNPLPVITVSISKIFKSSILKATSNTNNNYLWANGNTNNFITISKPSSPQTRTLLVTEKLHGCEKTFSITVSSSSPIVVKSFIDSLDNDLIIPQESSNLFNLYPNPNNGNMTLDYGYLTETNNGIVTVYDVVGNVVASYLLDNKTTQLQINNDLLNNGTYCYRVTIEGVEVKRDKIIIIK